MERLRILFGLSVIAILLGSGVLMTVFVLKQEEAQIDRQEWLETKRVVEELVVSENQRRTQSSTQPTATQAVVASDQRQRIPVNSATKAQLDSLPGIGEARATALLEARSAGGPFRDLDDIRARVSNIPASVLEQIAPEITFE